MIPLAERLVKFRRVRVAAGLRLLSVWIRRSDEQEVKALLKPYHERAMADLSKIKKVEEER